jgi:hypothetical protein
VVVEHRVANVVLAWALAASLAEGLEPPSAPGAPVDPDGEAVLAAFLGRPDEPVSRYRARRRMEVVAMGEQAWLELQAELDPGRGFRWTVLSEGGSRMLREKSLLRLLRAEAEAHASALPSRSALTSENYLLEPEGRDPAGLVRLRARPRRREAALIDGFFTVAPDTADLVRVEGALARAPSFWVKHVEVSRHFARVRGHRVVVRMESVAQIRFVGPSHLVVTYDYEMIDGHAIPPYSVLAAVVPATPASGP